MSKYLKKKIMNSYWNCISYSLIQLPMSREKLTNIRYKLKLHGITLRFL